MEGLFPEVVFHVLGLPVRDTVLSTWVMMALIALTVYVGWAGASLSWRRWSST